MRRLNLWDFDDTLAWSNEAVERFVGQHPDVEKWRWWHDEEYSVQAALETLPMDDMWALLGKIPGDHWILTGRVRKAVEEWMRIWSHHPDLGPYVKKVDKVISTSGAASKHLDVALKKQEEVGRLLQVYDEIHIYDDRRMNLEAISAISDRVKPHLVADGRIVSASLALAPYRGLRAIRDGLATLQGMDRLSSAPAYIDLYLATLSTIRAVHDRMTMGLTADTSYYAT